MSFNYIKQLMIKFCSPSLRSCISKTTITIKCTKTDRIASSINSYSFFIAHTQDAFINFSAYLKQCLFFFSVEGRKEGMFERHPGSYHHSNRNQPKILASDRR